MKDAIIANQIEDAKRRAASAGLEGTVARLREQLEMTAKEMQRKDLRLRALDSRGSAWINPDKLAVAGSAIDALRAELRVRDAHIGELKGELRAKDGELAEKDAELADARYGPPLRARSKTLGSTRRPPAWMELQTGSAVWIANDSFIKHCACLLRRLLLSPPSSSPPVTRSMACTYSICTPSPPSSSSSLSLSFQSRKETTQTAVSLYLTTKCSVCAAICYVQAGQRLQARWSFTRASKCCSTRHKIAAPKREQLRHSRRPARSTVVVREFEELTLG